MAENVNILAILSGQKCEKVVKIDLFLVIFSKIFGKILGKKLDYRNKPILGTNTYTKNVPKYSNF